MRKVRSGGKVTASTIWDLIPSWERSLQARNLSDKTVHVYAVHVRRLVQWYRKQNLPDQVAAVTRADIQRYFAESLAGGSAAKSVANYHGVLRVFFKWCVDEGEIAKSPMAGILPPFVPESPPELLTDEQTRAILGTCEGRDHTRWMDYRDAALLRVLIDCGLRRSEVSSMTVDGTDLAQKEAKVFGKGRFERTVVLHDKTVAALDRYLRNRKRHIDHDKPDLWLGGQGPLGSDGVYEVVRRRARQANLPRKVWPHLFRHGAVSQWLEEGGQEHDGAKLFGWKSTEQFSRYGAAHAAKRARESAKKMQGGDRF